MECSNNNKKELSYFDISNRNSSILIEINKGEENKIEKANERIELSVDLKKLLNDKRKNIFLSLQSLVCSANVKIIKRKNFSLNFFQKQRILLLKNLILLST